MSSDSRPTSGIALARTYWTRIVRPLLLTRWPDLAHAAGRVGQGSDVLGLDDEISRDHDWGLRLSLLVEEDMVVPVRDLLAGLLPESFAGLPTRFAFTGDASSEHHVEVRSVSGFARERLGCDPRTGLGAAEWLSISGQSALEITAGAVFSDTTGELTALRRSLRWYPEEIWRYVVACDWARIGEELPLLGRAGQRGDDLGSRVIAARMVDVCMHLAFLLERQWAPYSKWRGTLLRRLQCGDQVAAPLVEVMGAASWRERQAALARSLDVLLRLQRSAGLPAAEPAAVAFWDRPFVQPNPRIVETLREGISSPEVLALVPGRGSVEQRTDNVAILTDVAARRALVGLRG